jgi:hypothetical protein
MKTTGIFILKRWTVFFALFVVQATFSQNEGKIWYFGANAGLDFNQSPPAILHDGQLNTVEGTATIADANGNLLFYTDGISIYNATHSLMPNGQGGLGGHTSSAQSALIVPFPGQENKYFVFAVTAYPTSNLVYSIVDMTLNNGLGDVIETSKALPLLNGTGEYIQAIGSQDRSFWWILTHKAGTSDYYAYQLTAEGLDLENPVISTSGIQSQPGGEIGLLKFNTLGNKMVRSAYISGYVEISDFNPLNGIVSNSITFNFQSAYGVEFSPNNNYLYVSSFTNQGLSQFDIATTNTPTEILASQYVYSTLFTGSVQAAPDGKIYATRYGALALDVIHQPNNQGQEANFQLNSQSLGNAWAQLGFPNIISTFVSTAQPTLDNLQANNITFESAAISVDIISDGGNEITQSGFYFGTDPENLDQISIIEPGQGTMSTTLNDLQPETEYYFSAFATNMNGTAILEGGSFITLTNVDNIPPVAICAEGIVLELDEYGFAFLTVEMIDNGSYDNDAIAEIYIDKTDFYCENLGENIVILTVVDVSGNTSTCSTTVYVQDNIAPEIFVELDSNLLETPANQPYILPDYFGDGIAWAIDNCTANITQFFQTPQPGTSLIAGTHLISLSARDDSGNSSTISFEIIVETFLSANDFNLKFDLSIYPNPTVDYFKISNQNQLNIDSIDIFDLNGRLINNFQTKGFPQIDKVNVSHLAAATYLIVIKGEGTTLTKKLIKR